MTTDIVKEYSRTLRIPVYDVGPANTLKFGSALRLVQETSEQHLGVTHVSYEEMREKSGLVFFIISTRAKLLRMPAHKEEITITTRPCGHGGAQFYRSFLFYGAGKELLIDVTQTTVLADAATHKVQRPQLLKPYGIYPENVILPKDRLERFTVPEDLPFIGDRRVFHSDLDANGHMNNSVYGDIVWDFLPPGVRRVTGEIQINYLCETSEGDTLKIYAGESGGEFLMRGQNSTGLSFTAAFRERPGESFTVQHG